MASKLACSLWQPGSTVLRTTLLRPRNFSLLNVGSKTALWPLQVFLPALPNGGFLLLVFTLPCTPNQNRNALAQDQQGKHSAKCQEPQE